MIYLVILLAAACIALFFFIRTLQEQVRFLQNKEKQELKDRTNEIAERTKELVEQRAQVEQDLLRKQTSIQELERQEYILQDRVENLTKNSLKEAAEKINTEQTKMIAEAQEKHQKVIEQMLTEEVELEKMIQPLRNSLNEYKEKVKAFNETLQFNIEKEMEKAFYRIELTEFEKEDIKYLMELNKQLHNKSILPRLVWETYIRPSFNLMCKRVLNNEDKSGIYKITDSRGKAYVGKSTGIKTRWRNHLKTVFGLPGASRQEIHNGLLERGVDDFTFEVLEYCDKELLSERERYYIEFFETNKIGYNIRK